MLNNAVVFGKSYASESGLTVLLQTKAIVAGYCGCYDLCIKTL